MKSLQDELKQYILDLVNGEKLSLVNLQNGAAIEAFDQALEKVIRNCADINTALGKREIILKVGVTPTRDRSMVTFMVNVSSKLAGMAAIEGQADIRIDSAGKGHFAQRRKEPKDQDIFGNVTHMKGPTND